MLIIHEHLSCRTSPFRYIRWPSSSSSTEGALEPCFVDDSVSDAVAVGGVVVVAVAVSAAVVEDVAISADVIEHAMSSLVAVIDNVVHHHGRLYTSFHQHHFIAFA